MLDRYLIFHFWSGPQLENQYGRHSSKWPPHGYTIHCSFNDTYWNTFTNWSTM